MSVLSEPGTIAVSTIERFPSPNELRASSFCQGVGGERIDGGAGLIDRLDAQAAAEGRLILVMIEPFQTGRGDDAHDRLLSQLRPPAERLQGTGDRGGGRGFDQQTVP